MVLTTASHADRMAVLCQQHRAVSADTQQACLEAARAAHQSHQQRMAAWQATFLERQQRARCAGRQLLTLTRSGHCWTHVFRKIRDTCVQKDKAVHMHCLPAHTLCISIAANDSVMECLQDLSKTLHAG